MLPKSTKVPPCVTSGCGPVSGDGVAGGARLWRLASAPRPDLPPALIPLRRWDSGAAPSGGAGRSPDAYVPLKRPSHGRETLGDIKAEDCRVALEPTSVAGDISKPILTTRVLLGQDENLVTSVSQEAGNKAILLAMAVKDRSMEVLKALKEVIQACQNQQFLKS
ncbi:Proteasome assembly chaperone 3 [Manis javanica]|nr:Proteasome assembly chaperone 3 [Manis javanica]